jgi:hypothetical protein
MIALSAPVAAQSDASSLSLLPVVLKCRGKSIGRFANFQGATDQQNAYTRSYRGVVIPPAAQGAAPEDYEMVDESVSLGVPQSPDIEAFETVREATFPVSYSFYKFGRRLGSYSSCAGCLYVASIDDGSYMASAKGEVRLRLKRDAAPQNLEEAQEKFALWLLGDGNELFCYSPLPEPVQDPIRFSSLEEMVEAFAQMRHKNNLDSGGVFDEIGKPWSDLNVERAVARRDVSTVFGCTAQDRYGVAGAYYMISRPGFGFVEMQASQ